MAEDLILEVKETLEGEIQTFECRAVARSSTEAVILYEIRHPMKVEDLTLPVGTLSFGYFWTDRYYNAYHWFTPSGETLGVYFNISDSTRIGQGEVRWRDLVVDVLVTPDGRCRVIDEDQIPSDLDSRLLRKIEHARDDVAHRHKELLNEIEARTAELSAKAHLLRERPHRP
jgi:predicted RNA-binding protein associated with RNAse of E/G family